MLSAFSSAFVFTGVIAAACYSSGRPGEDAPRPDGVNLIPVFGVPAAVLLLDELIAATQLPGCTLVVTDLGAASSKGSETP